MKNFILVLLLASNVSATEYVSSVYVPNAPEGNRFAVSVSSELYPALLESNSFLLVNLATNTVTAKLFQLVGDVVPKTASAIFNIYSGPTASANGTLATIGNAVVGSTTTPQIQVFVGPTVSARGVKIATFSVGANSAAAVLPLNYNMVLSTGSKILITSFVSAASSPTISAIWTERNP